MSMSLTDMNGGNGASVSVGRLGPTLDPFETDVTLNIAALPVPEPTSAILSLCGAAVATLFVLSRLMATQPSV